MTYYWPMLAKSGSENDLTKPGYVWEMKWDGVRCLAHIYVDRVILRSRTGHDITVSFPEIVERLTCLQSPGLTCIDGEIICYDDPNDLMSFPNFQKLQTRLQRKTNIASAMLHAPAHYIAFDCLSYQGEDITSQPLIARKNILTELWSDYVPRSGQLDLPDATQPGRPFYYSHHHSSGKSAYKLAQAFKYEGVMAKLTTSPYSQGSRTNDWLKIKPVKTATVHVIACTQGIGKRRDSFGSLVVATTNTNLVPRPYYYAGLVGTGLTNELLNELTPRFTNAHAFHYYKYIDFPSNVQSQIIGWCDPFEIEVTYQELTKEDLMRFPSLSRVIEDE